MSIKGKKLYNNGKISKYFGIEDVIPDGFVAGPLEKDKERLASIAGNRKGATVSENTKQKISEIHKELYKDKTKHPMYGKHHSDETKQKLAEANKGKVSKNKGKVLSEAEKEAIKQKHINNYGSYDNYLECSVNKQKSTKLEKYGDSSYNNRAKAKETIRNIPDFYKNRHAKTIETKLKLYGSIENASLARKESLIKKYGFNSIEEYGKYWRTNVLKNVNNKKSNLEKKFSNFLYANNMDFINGYTVEKDGLSHEFDFAIFNNNKLNILIDCDGAYYHGYMSDVNGKSVNNYSDEYRAMLVPDGVKFSILVEGQEESFYNEVLSLIDIDYDDYIDSIYKWCRESSFPFPSYDDKVLQASLKSIINADVDKFNIHARYGEKLILHFHKSIWKCNKKGKLSPFQAWENDDLLIKAIKNRLIYKGTDIDKNRVLYGLTISGIAPRISIFNPYLAKYIIQKYLFEYDTIFDPCSGYSGRLLGCTTLNKKYIGQDINNTTVLESLELSKYLNLNCVITNKDSLQNYGKYPCLFTCPPYNDKENWGTENSYNFSCDEWIDAFIHNYDCNRYVFVVDHTDKYKDFIVETIENKSHFTNSKEFILCIDKK